MCTVYIHHVLCLQTSNLAFIGQLIRASHHLGRFISLLWDNKHNYDDRYLFNICCVPLVSLTLYKKPHQVGLLTAPFLMRKLWHREVKYWNLTKGAQLPNPGYHTALSRFYRLTWSQQNGNKYWEVNAIIMQWREFYFLLSRDLMKEIAFELHFKEWERFQLWEVNDLVMKIGNYNMEVNMC